MEQIRKWSYLTFVVFWIGSLGASTNDPAPNYTCLRLRPGIEFPLQERVLEGYRDKSDYPNMRSHAWKLFDGLTEPVGEQGQCGGLKAGDQIGPPTGEQDRNPCELALWETWYNKCDVMPDSTNCLIAASSLASPSPPGILSVRREFEVPEQPFFPLLDQIRAEVGALEGGDQIKRQLDVEDYFRHPEVLSKFRTQFGEILQSAGIARVLFSREAYRRIIRSQQPLINERDVKQINDSFDADNTPVLERRISEFPPKSVALKTVWRVISPCDPNVEKQRIRVWDRNENPPGAVGEAHPYGEASGWARFVIVDTANEDKRLGYYRECSPPPFAQHGVHVPISSFYHLLVTPQNVVDIRRELHRFQVGVGQGDYVVLVGMHLVTREIGDWVWATFWWYDNPDYPMYGNGRPIDLERSQTWRHYLMDTTLSMDTPSELQCLQAPMSSADNVQMPLGGACRAKICFNPYLEDGNVDGFVSNCMTCHLRAAYPKGEINNSHDLPGERGKLARDSYYFQTRTRTSFLWSVAIRNQSLLYQLMDFYERKKK